MNNPYSNQKGIDKATTIEELRHIPFAEAGDCNCPTSKHLINRSQKVRKFIEKHVDISKAKCLDCGSRNAFGTLLFGKDHDNTTGDLNESTNAPDSHYDFILCSEILEHIMNPLSFIRSLKNLTAVGGYCLVSTPLMMWHSGFSYQSAHHFTEYRADRLARMLKHAGFELVKWQKYLLWDWTFMFRGVRPFLRVLFHRNQMFLLRRRD